jgi:hypothetical protein
MGHTLWATDSAYDTLYQDGQSKPTGIRMHSLLSSLAYSCRSEVCHSSRCKQQATQTASHFSAVLQSFLVISDWHFRTTLAFCTRNGEESLLHVIMHTVHVRTTLLLMGSNTPAAHWPSHCAAASQIQLEFRSAHNRCCAHGAPAAVKALQQADKHADAVTHVH